MKLVKVVALLGIFIIGCQSKPIIEHFDVEAWQNDETGCNNVRGSLVETLMLQKEKLYGMGQEDIQDILGKPDRHELYSRNKKSFTYFVSPGPDCSTPSDPQLKLIVRFDGIGRAKEIIYYK